MFRRLYQQFRSGKQPASLNKKFSLIAISNLNPLCCSTCTAYLMSCQMPTILLLTFCWMRPRMLSPNIKIYEKEWHTYLPKAKNFYILCTRTNLYDSLPVRQKVLPSMYWSTQHNYSSEISPVEFLADCRMYVFEQNICSRLKLHM